MKHYIITRNSYPASYEHAAARRELTLKYTVPSLQRQRNKDFVWVLAGTNGLSEADTRGINTVFLNTPPASNFDSTTDVIQQAISELAIEDPQGTKIVTTRLDNDDVLRPDFVSIVQEQAQSLDRGVIDLSGIRVDTRFGKVYEDLVYQKVPSPFLSMVEIKNCKRCRLASAYYDQHSLMHRHFPCHKLTEVGWVQIIHDTNKVMARPQAEVAARGRILDWDYADTIAALTEAATPKMA